MKHKDLLRSSWVKNDALSVKVQIELRRPVDLADLQDAWVEKERQVAVPESMLTQNLLSLYNGRYPGDVTFVVGDERIQAHAALLSVRSEVSVRNRYR